MSAHQVMAVRWCTVCGSPEAQCWAHESYECWEEAHTEAARVSLVLTPGCAYVIGPDLRITVYRCGQVVQGSMFNVPSGQQELRLPMARAGTRILQEGTEGTEVADAYATVRRAVA